MKGMKIYIESSISMVDPSSVALTNDLLRSSPVNSACPPVRSSWFAWENEWRGSTRSASGRLPIERKGPRRSTEASRARLRSVVACADCGLSDNACNEKDSATSVRTTILQTEEEKRATHFVIALDRIVPPALRLIDQPFTRKSAVANRIQAQRLGIRIESFVVASMKTGTERDVRRSPLENKLSARRHAPCLAEGMPEVEVRRRPDHWRTLHVDRRVQSLREVVDSRDVTAEREKRTISSAATLIGKDDEVKGLTLHASRQQPPSR